MSTLPKPETVALVAAKESAATFFEKAREAVPDCKVFNIYLVGQSGNSGLDEGYTPAKDKDLETCGYG